MNKQLQEFYLVASEQFKIVQDQGLPAPYQTRAFAEKFAELIVKECAELIDNKVMITAAQTYDEVFVAVYDTNFANAKKIKEHFGVEE